MQTLKRLSGIAPQATVAHTESEASQDRPENAVISNLVNEGEAPKKRPLRRFADLRDLAVASPTIDLEVPVPDDDLAPTEFGPVFTTEEQQVTVRKEHPDAAMRRTILGLKDQIKQLTATTDQDQIERIVRSLSSLPVDTAFNQAQTFYTTSLLEELDSPFAVKLAEALYQLFASQGRIYLPWAHFVSSHSVTQ